MPPLPRSVPGPGPIGARAKRRDALRRVALLGAILLALPLPATRAASDELFALSARLQLVLPAFARGTTLGDVNADGRPDLVCVTGPTFATTTTPGTVHVSLALPEGGYAQATNHSLGSGKGPIMAAVADLDGDGWPEILTANFASKDVTILAGAGGGALAPPVQIASSSGASFVAVADLDLDGIRDLVLATAHGKQITTYLGRGALQFSTGLPFDVGSYATGVRIGDVDGDGRPDLVSQHIAGSAPLVQHHRGLGDGTFEPAVAIALDWWQATSIVLEDVNLDGRCDLVFGGQGALLGVLLAGPGGVFGSSSSQSVAMAAPQGYPLVGDLDGDGVPDVVYVGSGQIATLLGRGDGSFDPAVADAAWAPSINSPGSATTLLLADVDQDGALDLLAARGQDGAVWVHPGQGNGDVVLPVTSRVDGLLQSLADVAGGQLDGDGRLDLVVSHPATDTVFVLRGGPGGNFITSGGFPAGDEPEAVALSDLDGDGRLDVIVANSEGATVSVLRGLPGAGFAAPQPFACGDDPSDLAIADLSGDGVPDAVVVNRYTDTLHLLRGDGAGGFLSPGTILPAGHTPTDVVLADLDGDGWREIVVLALQGHEVVLYRALGGGAYAAPEFHSAYLTEGTLACADVNADGLLDVVGAQWNPSSSGAISSMLVLLGKPGGGLRPVKTLVEVAWGIPSFGDFDGDGVQDLACLRTPARMSVSSGMPGGGFGPPVHMVLAGGPVAALAADFDGDGPTDVLALFAGVQGAASVEFCRNASTSAWTDLGHALAGGAGFAQLDGGGALSPGSTAQLALTGAAGRAPVVAVLGASSALLPFKGGTLVPSPQLLLPLGATDAWGQLGAAAHLPAGGLPPGATIVVQTWFEDAAAAHGWAASNALLGTAP